MQSNKLTQEKMSMGNQYYADIITGLNERTMKLLWMLVVVLILLLVGTNAAWIYYEGQWQVVETTEITQEATADNSGNAFVNNGGDFIYGESAADN